MPLTAVLLLLSISAADGVAAAKAPGRSTSAGPVIGLQAGRHAGGLGIVALYQQPLPGRPITLSAELGAGISGAVPRALVAAGGVTASYGRRHRAVVGIAWTALGRSTLSLHGTEVARRTLHGPALEGGYEFVSEGGLVVRAMAGAGYLSPSWQETLSRVQPTLTVTFGWKLR